MVLVQISFKPYCALEVRGYAEISEKEFSFLQDNNDKEFRIHVSKHGDQEFTWDCIFDEPKLTPIEEENVKLYSSEMIYLTGLVKSIIEQLKDKLKEDDEDYDSD